MAFLTQAEKIENIQRDRKDAIQHIKDTYSTLPKSFSSMAKAYKAVGFTSLGGTNISSKTKKDKTVNNYIMYLSPANLAGSVFGTRWNMCPFASVECRNACLSDSGHSKMDKGQVTWARIKRTALWFYNRELFMWILKREIERADRQSVKKGIQLAVRLNGTSDLMMREFIYEGKNILELFPDIQFYDYTKIPAQVKWAQGHSNYHVTFSYTGIQKNIDKTMELLLTDQCNVAVVFEQDIPAFWNGIEVIDGDDKKHGDNRFKDVSPTTGKTTGMVVGLKFKTVGTVINMKDNPFIIALDDVRRG